MVQGPLRTITSSLAESKYNCALILAHVIKSDEKEFHSLCNYFVKKFANTSHTESEAAKFVITAMIKLREECKENQYMTQKVELKIKELYRSYEQQEENSLQR